MINTKNIPSEILSKCEKKGDRHYDRIKYTGVTILRKIMEGLPGDAELIGANIVNACRRHEDKPSDGLIPCTPESYIHYTHKGHIVYIQMGRFWAFEGAMVSAYPIEDNTYYADKYPIYVPANSQDCIQSLINLANEPTEIYAKMEKIPLNSKANREYAERKRIAGFRFYCQ